MHQCIYVQKYYIIFLKQENWPRFITYLSVNYFLSQTRLSLDTPMYASLNNITYDLVILTIHTFFNGLNQTKPSGACCFFSAHLHP